MTHDDKNRIELSKVANDVFDKLDNSRTYMPEYIPVLRDVVDQLDEKEILHVLQHDKLKHLISREGLNEYNDLLHGQSGQLRAYDFIEFCAIAHEAGINAPVVNEVANMCARFSHKDYNDAPKVLKSIIGIVQKQLMRRNPFDQSRKRN